MTLYELTDIVTRFLWQVPAVTILLSVGFYLSVITRGVQFRRFLHAFRLLVRSVKEERQSERGEISSLQALAVSLGGTVGAGNITGVAAAIGFGGPGAIFWMWVTAIIGMATTYSCCSLAVRYRQKDKSGHYVGGPMYVLKNALHWPVLGAIFSVCTVFATIGSGNMIPANAMMDGLSYLYPEIEASKFYYACLFSLLVGLVVVGGVKRISVWMAKIVPFMCFGYVIAVLVILMGHVTKIPMAIATIINHALNPWAVGGGSMGAAIHYGVARGLFSNEAGQGSLPMIHALAQTDSPNEQGYLAMLSPFIDTIVVCTLTALVIIVMGVYADHLPEKMHGTQLAISAFNKGLGATGTWVVAVGLIIFAYSTIVAWAYYGEAAIKYLWPDCSQWAMVIYRCVYTLTVILGACLELRLVWNICDIAMVLMMLPNLMSLIMMSKHLYRQSSLSDDLLKHRSIS